nr:hypothetical protein [uncultured Roseateles sp.]
MIAADDLYRDLKPQIGDVSTLLFDFSERCLRDADNFLPHAAVLTEAGRIELVAAMAESVNGRTSSVEVLPLLHDGLRAQAKAKQIIAVGVAENVTVTPSGRPATQAIKVLFEHRRGLTVALYLPFKKRFLRGYFFGDIFSVLAAPEVKAWLENDV